MIRVDTFTFGYQCKLQNLVGAGGNVAALCNLFATAVLPNIAAINGTNLPPTEAQPLHFRNHGAVDRSDAVDALSTPIARAATAPVVIAVLGEDHDNDRDRKRAEDVIRRFMAMRGSAFANALIYLERGLKAKHQRLLLGHPEVVADEWDICGPYGSEINRSVIAAAYCVACLAGGDQSKKGRVLMLIGQNHVDDVVEAFRILTSDAGPFAWVVNRPRALHVLTNQRM